MERASQSELLWAYAITRDEYGKRLSEKSLLKTEDLEFIRDRIFELINRGEANIHDPKEKQQLQAVVEKYLPGFSANEQAKPAYGMTFKALAPILGLPEQVVEAMLAELDAL